MELNDLAQAFFHWAMQALSESLGLITAILGLPVNLRISISIRSAMLMGRLPSMT